MMAQDSWKAAAATADISPVQPVALAGYGQRPETFVAVESGLEANAVAFRLAGARCAVIMTLDTLFVGPMVHRALSDHFVREHRQQPDDLLILASHTHFAPAIDDTKPELGIVDPAYVALVIQKCRELINQVVGASKGQVTIEKFKGASSAAVNRRRRWMWPYAAGRRRIGFGTVMAPNPAGAIDPTISVWVVSDGEGRALALLWHYACHPTGLPHALHVSAEFPGTVRRRLRRRYRTGLPVLFLQGFAGDLRPRVPETRGWPYRTARSLVYGPGFDRFSPDGWRNWSESLSDDVEHALESGRVVSAETVPSTMPSICSASHAVPLTRIVAGENGDREIRFQRLKLASIIDIVAVAAEPLVGLGAFIPFPEATTVGYLGDVFGYWPTDGEARYGGYEVRHYLPSFGLNGRLKRGLDDVFRTAIDALRAPR